MAYVGRQPTVGRYIIIDSLTDSFDGSTVSFTLQSNGENIVPQAEQNCIISLSGVVQAPNDAFTISGSTITFASAPSLSEPFFGIVLGDVLNIGTPSDASVTASSLGSTFVSENNVTYNGDLTISTNKNAMVAGPFSVTGTLTVPTGSTFVIV